MKKVQTYDQEFKDKVVQEYRELGRLSEVARNNKIPVSTLRQWALNRDPIYREKKSEKRRTSELLKENYELKVQVTMLKELLKKTSQAWLKD